MSAAGGAILGALVGDAAGAMLGFSSGPIAADDVDQALSMVGRGPHRVAPGQITDDGEMALGETLTGGGDTDTNGCIVGGLVGALHGTDAIPQRMRDAVAACDVTRGRPRSEWLQTRAHLPGFSIGWWSWSDRFGPAAEGWSVGRGVRPRGRGAHPCPWPNAAAYRRRLRRRFTVWTDSSTKLVAGKVTLPTM